MISKYIAAVPVNAINQCVFYKLKENNECETERLNTINKQSSVNAIDNRSRPESLYNVSHKET